MPNTIFSSEGALLFIMVAMVALGFWLQRFKAFKTLGPALTVIIMGIVLSNLRIVPTSSATYDAVSSYCVPLSISICLLSLDLKQMRKLSKDVYKRQGELPEPCQHCLLCAAGGHGLTGARPDTGRNAP